MKVLGYDGLKHLIQKYIKPVKTKIDELEICGQNLARGTSSEYTAPYTRFSGSGQTIIPIGKVYTDGLSVGDTVTVRLIYKYDNIVPASGKTASCKIRGDGDVTAWDVDGMFPVSEQVTLSGSGVHEFWYSFAVTEKHLKNSYWNVGMRNDYVQSGSVCWKMFKVVPANLATQSAPGYMSAVDKAKLDGMAANANDYTHPSTHPASMIEQDATHRFVSDDEKSTWDNKANADHTHQYLPLTGGTVTGQTAFQKSVYVHAARGTDGMAGYVKIAQIEIAENYVNAPIIFEVIDRSANMPMEIYLRFASAGNTDPALEIFRYAGHNIGAYIVKAAAGIWDLYIKKSEAWDVVAITRYTVHPTYLYRVVVTWTNVHADSLPAGYIQAVPANLATQSAPGYMSAVDKAKLDGMAIPKKTTITIPTSGWGSDSDADYPKYYDIPVSGITANDRASIDFPKSSEALVKACGMWHTNDTMSGKIRIRAKKLPTAAIPAQYWIEKGKG